MPLISAEYVRLKAKEIGFDACGIAKAEPSAKLYEGLQDWLQNGCQADMHYMEQYREMRCNPQLLVEGAKTVISLAVGYKPDWQMPGPLKIAQYAYGEDYHEKIKRMLFQLIAAIKEKYPDFEAKPCVDTVPISDKYWAAASGIGWIGKNTLLITPTMGSYVNLAELVTTAEADNYDTPIENRCGSCRKCIDACPNKALDQVKLDARRCSSYNTIENRAESLPEKLDLKGYVFGCDCCQMVCPYNHETDPKIHISEGQAQELQQLSDADEQTFKHFSKHRALNRIKYSQWQRNINKAKH